MKRTVTALAILATLGLTACSSTKELIGMHKAEDGLPPAQDASVPVKETKISTEFSDEGVKIYYTSFGKLEKIEVYGIGQAWQGQEVAEIQAEANAMDKLVKFVHGKNVSSNRVVKLIGKAIEHSNDKNLNSFKTNDGTLNLKDSDIESGAAFANAGGDNTQRQNTAMRNAGILNTTLTNTVTEITSRGKLVGVRKIRGGPNANGQYYIAVFQWSDKDQDVSDYVRKRMTSRMGGN